MAGWREVVEALGMIRHPEGGWYVETWRAPAAGGERAAASAILYLLPTGEQSHWHRIDAAEIWQWSGGEAMELRMAASDNGPIETYALGPSVLGGEHPQVVVPAGAWQAARPVGAWSLVGCIVAPAFEFDTFQLAPPGWQPEPPGS